MKTLMEILDEAVESFRKLPKHIQEAAQKSGTRSSRIHEEKWLKEKVDNG